MALTHALLFFFALGGICLVAGAAVTGTLQLAAIGHERPSEIHALLRLARRAAVLVGIGAVLTLGFGIAAVLHDGIAFSAAWVEAALGLWVAGTALGGYGAWAARSLVGARAPLWSSWTSGLVLLGILALAIWEPTGSAAPSHSFPVPVGVRRAIARDYAQLAFLPTRLLPGLHYASYDGIRGYEFDMWFTGAKEPLEFSVEQTSSCASQPSAMQTFTVDGVDVSWSGAFTNQ